MSIQQQPSDDLSEEDNPEIKAYTSDPIGWLTGYFETEGATLEYSFAPGIGKDITICSIDIREVLQSGEEIIIKGEGRGRNEAKINAALAACQRIDNSQAQETSKSDFRTKRREYEENDYYSSDEDEFLDRTGQVAERRRKRQQRYGGVNTEKKALTHDDLVKQLEDAQQILNQVTKAHEQVAEDAKTTRTLTSKFLLSTSRQKLLLAQTEVRKLTTLVEASRPADVNKAFEKVASAKPAEPKKIVENVKKHKEEPDAQGFKRARLPSVIIHSDEPSPDQDSAPKVTEPEKRSAFGLIQRKDLQEMKNEALAAKKRKIESFDDEVFYEPASNRDEKTELKPEPEDDATWLPPEGQTGDGKTKLNDKFAGRY